MRLFERSDGRYYAIGEPREDLLGDQVIVTCHGSRFNRLGGMRSWPLTAVSVEAMVRVRLRHGYVERQQDPG